jgi:hypothetical protein
MGEHKQHRHPSKAVTNTQALIRLTADMNQMVAEREKDLAAMREAEPAIRGAIEVLGHVANLDHALGLLEVRLQGRR